MAENHRGDHLVLVGIRGSGKTTLGRLLARRMGCLFLDTDDLVAAAQGMSVSAIFERFGESRFRAAERQALAQIEDLDQPAVVATGGGIILDESNRIALRRAGLVVWLDLPTDVAAARIAGSDRPSLTGRPPAEELADIAAMRRTLYEEVADRRIQAAEHLEDLVADLEGLWDRWRRERKTNPRDRERSVSDPGRRN